MKGHDLPAFAPFLILIENSQDETESVAWELERLQSEIAAHVLFRTGGEALDYLFGKGTHSGRDVRSSPKAVMVNQRPPAVDAVEVLRELRAHARTRLIPTIVFAPSFSELELTSAYAAGANSCLPRPRGRTELEELVRRVCTYWLRLNVPAPAVGQGST